MRYILQEEYILCGWEKMPYALKNIKAGMTRAVAERPFELLFSCSGKKEIHMDRLDEKERRFLEAALKDGVIRQAKDGETRDLVYHRYKGMWKDTVQWSITGKCNYRCRHCFQSAPEGVLGEPTFAQCMEILHQLHDCGIDKIGLTGGEPLIRKDLLLILDEIKRLGMHVTMIYSNGRLVTDPFLDELEKRDMRPIFQISFDGVGCHDWMRGVEGAEKIALDTFRRLKRRDFEANSAMCLCKDNVASMRETVRELAKAGCTRLKFQRSMPMGEWASQKEHFLSYDETLQAYLDYLPQYKEDGMPLDLQMEGFFGYSASSGYMNLSNRHGKEEMLDKMPPCGVIESSLYIGPNGAVTPCMSMNGSAVEAQFPNIFEMSLDRILKDSSYTTLTGYRVKDVLDHTPKCRNCRYRLECCAGCRAFALGEDGTDYLSYDPITCKILTEGWSERLDQVAGALFGKDDAGTIT